MSGSPDSSNLMYVTKSYEEEVKNKAKVIYANDEVNLTLENTNKQLDDIINEINDKLGFVVNKIDGEYGVDSYVQGVHTQIDKVNIEQDTLVSDNVKNTTTHPSVMAFKSDREATKFNTYDFINKSIEFSNSSPFLALTGSKQIDSEQGMLTFNFNASSKEYLKIIEFSFTYKQYPDIVNVNIDGNVSKETTVTVTRIISGRFFLIRHDPVEHPNEFIIKAIINNSDNTGNIIDRKIIDVQNYKDTKNFSYIFDNGPQFDLYFTFDDNSINGLKIHFGKIVPYRYVVRKNYINTNDGTIDTNFKKIDMTSGATDGIGTHNIEDIYHSSNLSCSFIVDKTRNEISIINDGNKFDNRHLSTMNDIGHVSGSKIDEFWVKDVLGMTFIRLKDVEHNTCFVGVNNVSNLVDIGRPILDVIGLSTNEILVKLSNNYYYFDTVNNVVSTSQFYSLVNDEPTFTQNTIILEYLNKYLIQFYTKTDGLYYRIKDVAANNTYIDNPNISPEHKVSSFPDTRVNLINPTSGTISGFVDATGIYIGMNYSGADANESFIVHCNKLSVTGISYIFEESTVLNVFNKLNNSTSNLQNKIKKIVSTKLFNFLITENEELFIFDEDRIVKAITFEEVPDRGWTDKNSVLYMEPESNQDEYYLVNNAYLQNVKDVFDTPNGVIIVDKKGIYSVEDTKNIDCKLFLDNDAEIVKYLPSFDKYGKSGVAITLDNPLANIFKYSVYKNDYVLKEMFGDKVRYEYLDLFTSDYQLYDENVSEYDSETPIIDFHSILYVSFVDHLSTLYNSTGATNITTDEYTTYGTVTEEGYAGKKYCVSTNKYGFIKYDNILSVDTSKSRISDINAVKKLKIIHKPTDNFTYNEALNVIHELVKSEYNKYREDMVYVKGSKRYEPHNNKNVVLNTTDCSQFDGLPSEFLKYVDTKYGRYGIYPEYLSPTEYTYLFGWQSPVALDKTIDEIKSDPTLFLSFDNFVGNFDFELDSPFELVVLDDEFGTVFVSNGTKVITCKARNANHQFALPFSISTSGGDENKVAFEPKTVIVDPDTGTGLTNIRLCKDGEVIGWNSNYGYGDIYTYNSASDTFIKVETAKEIFNDTVNNRDYAKILDVIKINNNYHIIGLYDMNDGTNYELIYLIRGGKNLVIDTSDTLIPSAFSKIGDSTSRVEFFDFNSTPVLVVQNKPFTYISKYDATSDTFKSSIYPVENDSVDDRVNLKLLEIKNDENVYEIYGVSRFAHDGQITKNFYPIIFKYNYKTDNIEQLCGNAYLNYSTFLNLDYNSREKYIRAIYDLRRDDSSGDILGFVHIRYFYEKTFDNIVHSTIYTPAVSPFAISDPIESVINPDTPNEKLIYDMYSLATHEVDGESHIYLTEMNQNTVAREMFRLGHNNQLSSIIPMPKLTEDASPDDSKTYYKIDTSITKFNKYPDMSTFPSGLKKNLVKIFERVIVPGAYVRIDKTVIREPTPGINYYKLALNGSYELQIDLKAFDAISEYFIEKSYFKLIEPDEIEGYPIFDNSQNVNGQARYFTSVDPKFVECTEDDFDFVPSLDGLTNTKEFNSSEFYYELEDVEVKVNISEKNLRILDNKLFVYVIHDSNGEAIGTFDTNDFNDCLFVYDLTDPVLNIDQEFRHELLEHLAPDVYYDIFNSDICKLGYVKRVKTALNGNPETVIQLVRISDDLSVIRDEYEEASVPYEKYISYDSSTVFEVTETSNNVFVSIGYTKDTSNINKTLVINRETLICRKENENNIRLIRHITEFEDGNIYGQIHKASTTLDFVKFGVNDTLSFTDINSENNLSIETSGFNLLKTIPRICDDGRKELLIFGTISNDGSNKYSVYRLYDNTLTPYDDSIIQSIIKTPYFFILDQWLIDYKNNLIYNIETKELSHIVGSIPSEYDARIDELGVTCIESKLYSNADRDSIIFTHKTFFDRTDVLKTFVLEKDELNFDPYNEFDENTSLYKRVYEMAETEQTVMVGMVKQLPIISNDGELFYTMAKADTKNLLPTYERKYDAYESDATTLRHRNCTFDKLYNTSIGIFGVLGLEIYLNEVYQNNNGFIYVGTLSKWTDMQEATPCIQENDGEIYLTYRDIYKFDKVEKVFNKLLSFDVNEVITSRMKNNIDKFEILDKYYTKLFITEFKDMYYFINVDNSHNVYKYSKDEHIFKLHHTLDGNPIVIKEISLGVIALTDEKTVENVSRGEKLDTPSPIQNTVITYLLDISESSDVHDLVITFMCDNDTRYWAQYNYETKLWETIGSTDVADATYLESIIVDSDDNLHNVLCIPKYSEDQCGYIIEKNLVQDEDQMYSFNLKYQFFNKLGDRTTRNGLICKTSSADPDEICRLYPVLTSDGSVEFIVHDVTNSDLYSLTMDYNKDSDEIELHSEKLELKSFKIIKNVMKFNNIYIFKNYNGVSLSGYNIDEKEIYDPLHGYKCIGYTYSVIGSNSKKWNNELSDVSNTLRDKYLLKVFGMCKEDVITELFIDNNSDYHSDVDLENSKRMELVEFYKKYYFDNWEKNLRNHIFERRQDSMYEMYIDSRCALASDTIFDTEQFEIELNIFGSPLLTEEENKIDSMRLSTSWYLKKLNRHIPYSPYYPFTDGPNS